MSLEESVVCQKESIFPFVNGFRRWRSIRRKHSEKNNELVWQNEHFANIRSSSIHANNPNHKGHCQIKLLRKNSQQKIEDQRITTTTTFLQYFIFFWTLWCGVFFVCFLTGVYCPCCQFGLQRTALSCVSFGYSILKLLSASSFFCFIHFIVSSVSTFCCWNMDLLFCHIVLWFF